MFKPCLVFQYAMGLTLASIAFSQDRDDTNLWLEDVSGERALSWVKERNAESTGEFTNSDAFKDLKSRLIKILDSDERIPLIEKHGPHYYNFWRDAKNKRGLWRRTTLEEYRKANPAWETVLDVDALAENEKENWVWSGATFLKPACERCLVELSRGGADAAVVREFDVTTKSFVKDGFTLPEAKSVVAWRGLDSLFVATDFGPGSLTTSGYPRIVKEWQRGNSLKNAPLVLEGEPTDMRVVGYRELAEGFERDILERRINFWKAETFLRQDGKLIKLELPDDAKVNIHHQWLFVELRTTWSVGGKDFAPGSLIVIDFDSFLKGNRAFQTLFEPTERTSLTSYSPMVNHVIVKTLENVRSRSWVLTPGGSGGWQKKELTGASEFSTTRIFPVDDDKSDDYFMLISDYLTPPSLYFGPANGAPVEKLKEMPRFFDAAGLSVTQHEAISKDGTRIPYFQVAKQGLDLNKANPTLLTGYGGFEIPRLPDYNPLVGAAWLEKGGVFVVANIRGGGEFGPKWHQAALKANRPRAYEDFIAVAEGLIARKVTSPKHLGIMGGSNGGLLMGNMLTLRPDLFGAIVCQVPLLDMQRYHKLLAGASWMAEYGNPDDPKEWEFIQSFSPYHNVKPDAKYPRILFTTSTRDDRVHPSHARRMAAKMKSQGHDVVYYENIEGGHGGAADNSQRAFMDALAYTFLWKHLK